MTSINIKGARVHNLKNIDLAIPKNKLVVVTGLSGSGKSSLAFDTIYAEGQRRYVESLSSYARQFLGTHDKPDVDSITGLSPAIAINQRPVSTNPRSTVGTITEIYDRLRIMFARLGTPHCPKCHQVLVSQTKGQILKNIIKDFSGLDVLVISPIVNNQKGEHKNILSELSKSDFTEFRINNRIYHSQEIEDIKLDKNKKHTIEVVVAQLKIPAGIKTKTIIKSKNFKKQTDHDLLFGSLTTALELANGAVVIYEADKKIDHFYSNNLVCKQCNIHLDSIEPRLFSFNSPHGACLKCKGLGTKIDLDPDMVVPNKKLTIAQGAIRPWLRLNSSIQSSQMKIINKIGKKYDFSVNTPWDKLSHSQRHIILYGTSNENYSLCDSKDEEYPGIINCLLKKYEETDSDYIKNEISKYMRIQKCPVCNGGRLNTRVLAVTFQDKNISEISNMPIIDVKKFFTDIKLSKQDQTIGEQLIKEIIFRLDLVSQVGLDYLSLDRSAETLSGGEAQRTRLATQIGSGLSGVIYILDEPSIGLHQCDNDKLINTLRKLKDLDNTVIVVEHDEATIKAADWVIDVGPGAGKHGGEIIAEGKPCDLVKNKKSLTADYLSGRKKITPPLRPRPGSGKNLEIIGAQEFNLQNIDVNIPLGKLVCVSGVSGSGKSTLVTDILSRALAQKFHRAKDIPGEHKQIKGMEYINKVVTIDQSPIGRTPRSNPATYSGVFTYIRDLFTNVAESKIKGLTAGHFSFNVKGGRCEVCEGDGVIKIEMHFLPDVYITCEECEGRRYCQEVLDIHWQGKNIAQVLEMTVEEALEFFKGISSIEQKLKILDDVGLGYIHLGQSATTLSGGEAQRVKLATELSRRATGRTFYILDEPTTGLHFEDIKKLLNVLNRLVDKGNTVLVIEHNLDVIKCADHIIDLGPGGGDQGGRIVAEGTPSDISNCCNSYTGKFLKQIL